MPGPTGLVALQQLEVEMKTRKCFFPSVAHSLFMARFLKYQRFLKAHRVSRSHSFALWRRADTQSGFVVSGAKV